MAAAPKLNRFKILPADECSVCQRVALIRRTQALSQAEFAKRIGSTRDQVANIESSRVNLKWSPGWAMCRAFDVSHLWLSLGKAPIHPFFNPLGDADQAMIPKDASFLAVCKGQLWKASRPPALDILGSFLDEFQRADRLKVTAAHQKQGYMVFPLVYKFQDSSGFPDHVRISSVRPLVAAKLLQKIKSEKDPEPLLLLSLPAKNRKDKFLNLLSPLCLSDMIGSAVLLTYGDEVGTDLLKVLGYKVTPPVTKLQLPVTGR